MMTKMMMTTIPSVARDRERRAAGPGAAGGVGALGRGEQSRTDRRAKALGARPGCS